MKLHLYQIIITTLSAIMIYQGILRYVKGKAGQTFLKLLVRIIVWGSLSLIALFPSLTNTFAEVIGMQGNLNAVILTGFIFIFLMMFKLLSLIEQLEQGISELSRKDALKEIQKN